MVHVWVFSAVSALASDGWIVLQVEQVHVRCRDLEGGGSECEATARIGAAVDPLCDILRDLPDWPRIFSNVASASLVSQEEGGPETYQLELRLPWPLGARTMVTQVRHEDDGMGHHAVTLLPVDGDPLWTRASWHVMAIGEETEVSYRWHTEALSSLPAWIRRGLLRRTGHHVMWGLALAAHSRPVAPPPT